MENSGDAAPLNLTNPVRTYTKMVETRSKQYAGDALYRKVIDDASLATTSRPVTAPSGCFAAGTLVHARHGLTPIEQIRVGDWVLSQSEAKDGSAPAYKQVVNTFAFEDKEVTLVRCYKPDGDPLEQFVVTANHPFWVKGIGWTRADQLYMGSELEFADGTVAITLCATPIYRTAEAGIGWVIGAWGVEANNGAGDLVDLRDGSIVVATEDTFNWDFLDDQGNYAPFHARVFNLEVHDFHTYYVGTQGVWVHNTNCGDIGVSLVVGSRPRP